MYTNLKQLLTLLLFFSFFSFAQAQNSYWIKIKNSDVSQKEILERNTTPENYDLYSLDKEMFLSALENAPIRGTISGKSPLIIELPVPSGKLETFRVTESHIMPEGLSSRYENIKTYSAVGIDDPTAVMRFSVTQFGVHYMSFSGKEGQSFLDPYTADGENYIVYYKNELPQDRRTFECITEEGDYNLRKTFSEDEPDTIINVNDSKLRKFRLALSAHQDYGNFFIANSEPGEEKADILAQMVIAVNRVNSIFERDLGITLELVENNDDLIFFSGIGENPWQGADGTWDFFTGAFNMRTQEVHDDIIGDENYDIGHNFNTSGGGNAGCIGCVCVSGQKGSAYTGLPYPHGDSFYVDFVAHEMGHQFGGYHVMNTCSRSGSGFTEVEPASGSTIMGYAGVCDYNVQYSTDSHFNYVNIRDIRRNIKQGSLTCGEVIEIENQPPVANAGDDYVIPKSTAFVLTGEATDPDGMETLTYEWAQNDPQKAATPGPLNPNLTQGAIYRSYTPKETPERYFPLLEAVVAGFLNINWEVTPDVARTMNFSFIVRDNGSGFADAIGQTDSDLMKITVDANAGPFKVTSQDEEDIHWVFDTTQEVTWDVANTDNDQIDAQEVDILLSVDGGQNFDIVLAEAVPNNGLAEVEVPEIETTKARLMVKASENVFFAVNDEEFTITEFMSVDSHEMASIKIYPNPNDGKFNISLPSSMQNETMNIGVYDLQGRMIYQEEWSNHNEPSIELNQVNPGLYILRIDNGSDVMNKKLIIR